MLSFFPICFFFPVCHNFKMKVHLFSIPDTQKVELYTLKATLCFILPASNINGFFSVFCLVITLVKIHSYFISLTKTPVPESLSA